MRPIEKRIAAVEARVTPPTTQNARLFFLPREGDAAAFKAHCRKEAAGALCLFVRFVKANPQRQALLQGDHHGIS